MTAAGGATTSARSSSAPVTRVTTRSPTRRRDQLRTLLLTGHETTTVALAWTFERLLRHPAALRRLADELEAGQETYLDAVVAETLRLRPPLPLAVRTPVATFALGPYRIPPTARIAVSLVLIHRQPDLYPRPLRFLPERFLERPPETYTWIPFGRTEAMRRRCLRQDGGEDGDQDDPRAYRARCPDLGRRADSTERASSGPQARGRGRSAPSDAVKDASSWFVRSPTTARSRRSSTRVGIVHQFIAADTGVPKEVNLPRPPEREIARQLQAAAGSPWSRS